MNSDETSTNDEDEVWDDSLLIEAYDKAVSIVHNEVLKNLPSCSDKGKDGSGKSKKKIHWNVGDRCRSEYSEDHNYYEADIIDIIDDLQMCIVKYVGYENEEKVPLNKLKPSKGDAYRTLQVKQALEDKNMKDEPAEEKPAGQENGRGKKKKNGGKKSEKSKSKENLQTSDIYLNSSHAMRPPTGTIPPPPPPHIFSKLKDDICESEAMSAMLMSWYMSGYHTGYYQGLMAAKKK